jgi:hypothetical protein
LAVVTLLFSRGALGFWARGFSALAQLLVFCGRGVFALARLLVFGIRRFSARLKVLCRAASGG